MWDGDNRSISNVRKREAAFTEKRQENRRRIGKTSKRRDSEDATGDDRLWGR